jgi:nucleoside-diphosphate-sugar epimerase
MSDMELHVIFGTGPLGKWTARELSKLGKRARLVNRTGQAMGLPPGAEVIKADAYDAANNIKITKNAAAIYQCAQPAYYEWPQKFPAFQDAILQAAIANGAKFIAAENLYVYGDTHGQPMTEDTPYAAHTRKGKTRQAMTEALFAAHKAGKVRAASARGSDFFGPDDSVSASMVYQPALQGKTVNAMGRLDMPHTFTYAPDFGKTLAILGTRDEALGRAWHVPSAAAITQKEYQNQIAQEIGRPIKAMAMSAPMLRFFGLFNKMAAEMPEMLYEFTQPFVMDSSRFTKTFGMEATPIKEAICQTVAWNRDEAMRNKK